MVFDNNAVATEVSLLFHTNYSTYFSKPKFQIIFIFQPKRRMYNVPTEADSFTRGNIDVNTHKKRNKFALQQWQDDVQSATFMVFKQDRFFFCSMYVTYTQFGWQFNGGWFLYRFGSDAALVFLFHAINCDLIVGVIGSVLTTTKNSKNHSQSD